MVKVKNPPTSACLTISRALGSGLLLLALCSWTVLPQALAQSTDHKAQGNTGFNPEEGKRKSQVPKNEPPVGGKIIGHPFKLVKASYTSTSIILDGGDIVASDPSKGRNKIAIDFPWAQSFGSMSYRIPYNAKQAQSTKGETNAPKISYTGLDKSGAVVTKTATNGSKSDELDYAMEIKFDPIGKNGELPGYVRLQIGSEPITDLTGTFYASH